MEIRKHCTSRQWTTCTDQLFFLSSLDSLEQCWCPLSDILHTTAVVHFIPHAVFQSQQKRCSRSRQRMTHSSQHRFELKKQTMSDTARPLLSQPLASTYSPFAAALLLCVKVFSQQLKPASSWAFECFCVGLRTPNKYVICSFLCVINNKLSLKSGQFLRPKDVIDRLSLPKSWPSGSNYVKDLLLLLK